MSGKHGTGYLMGIASSGATRALPPLARASTPSVETVDFQGASLEDAEIPESVLAAPRSETDSPRQPRSRGSAREVVGGGQPPESPSPAHPAPARPHAFVPVSSEGAVSHAAGAAAIVTASDRGPEPIPLAATDPGEALRPNAAAATVEEPAFELRLPRDFFGAKPRTRSDDPERIVAPLTPSRTASEPRAAEPPHGLPRADRNKVDQPPRPENREGEIAFRVPRDLLGIAQRDTEPKPGEVPPRPPRSAPAAAANEVAAGATRMQDARDATPPRASAPSRDATPRSRTDASRAAPLAQAAQPADPVLRIQRIDVQVIQPAPPTQRAARLPSESPHPLERRHLGRTDWIA